MSSSSSAAAVIGVVAVAGLLRSIPSGVGEGTLGESFYIIEQAVLGMPQGSFWHELDYPWGLFSALDVAVGKKKLTNRMN